MTYRLLTYFAPGSGAPRAGLLAKDRVIDLESGVKALGGKAAIAKGCDATSVMSVLQDWDANQAALNAVAESGGDAKQSWALKDTRLAAPMLYPNTIFCAAANYQDHFLEMSGKEVDKTTINPYFFTKVARQTIIGTGGEIRKPPFVQKLDWEAELAVVIGRKGKNIKAADALKHVAGYTIINDLSARDYIRRDDWPRIASDWMYQKSFDTSAPMGPWITPAGEIADPQNLKLNTWVNGTLEQDTHSKYMVFTVVEQIVDLSKHVTLWPGDVIATGTGGGVGHPRGKYLNPGDNVRIEIEGLGEISNNVVQGD